MDLRFNGQLDSSLVRVQLLQRTLVKCLTHQTRSNGSPQALLVYLMHQQNHSLKLRLSKSLSKVWTISQLRRELFPRQLSLLFSIKTRAHLNLSVLWWKTRSENKLNSWSRWNSRAPIQTPANKHKRFFSIKTKSWISLPKSKRKTKISNQLRFLLKKLKRQSP